MSQPSKPAVMLRRLQRALSRSKSSKSKEGAASATISAPSTPAMATFQHSNGRRLSFSQYIHHQQHHSQGSYSVQIHTPHCHQHIPDYHYDTPLYSLQRRRNVNSSSMDSKQRSCSPGPACYHPTAVDTAAFSKGPLPSSSSKLARRSGPPANFPVITIHHIQPDQHYSSGNGTYVTLTRSKSMPLRRRKRFSQQAAPPLPPTLALAPNSMGSYCLMDSPVPQQQQHSSQWTSYSPVPAPSSPTHHSHQQNRYISPSSSTSVPTKPDADLETDSATNIVSAGLAGSACAAGIARPDTGALERSVLDLDLMCPVPGPTFTSDTSSSQSRSSHLCDTTASPTTTVSTTALPGLIDWSGSNDRNRMSAVRSASASSSYSVHRARPSRSPTGSSLFSLQSSATMAQVDSSSMSIQSHLSEVSMLSAAMSASGLPSMDMMMDQVDKSIAADRQAQLVENAHVSVPHVTYVNRSILVEPCSAKIETWVN